MAWQLIETAPKTGEILTYGPETGVYVSTWNANSNNWCEAKGEEYWTYDDPTHWMPVPAPPGHTTR